MPFTCPACSKTFWTSLYLGHKEKCRAYPAWERQEAIRKARLEEERRAYMFRDLGDHVSSQPDLTRFARDDRTPWWFEDALAQARWQAGAPLLPHNKNARTWFYNVLKDPPDRRPSEAKVFAHLLANASIAESDVVAALRWVLDVMPQLSMETTDTAGRSLAHLACTARNGALLRHCLETTPTLMTRADHGGILPVEVAAGWPDGQQLLLQAAETQGGWMLALTTAAVGNVERAQELALDLICDGTAADLPQLVGVAARLELFDFVDSLLSPQLGLVAAVELQTALDIGVVLDSADQASRAIEVLSQILQAAEGLAPTAIAVVTSLRPGPVTRLFCKTVVGRWREFKREIPQEDRLEFALVCGAHELITSVELPADQAPAAIIDLCLRLADVPGQEHVLKLVAHGATTAAGLQPWAEALAAAGQLRLLRFLLDRAAEHISFKTPSALGLALLADDAGIISQVISSDPTAVDSVDLAGTAVGPDVRWWLATNTIRCHQRLLERLDGPCLLGANLVESAMRIFGAPTSHALNRELAACRFLDALEIYSVRQPRNLGRNLVDLVRASVWGSAGKVPQHIIDERHKREPNCYGCGQSLSSVNVFDICPECGWIICDKGHCQSPWHWAESKFQGGSMYRKLWPGGRGPYYSPQAAQREIIGWGACSQQEERQRLVFEDFEAVFTKVLGWALWEGQIATLEASLAEDFKKYTYRWEVKDLRGDAAGVWVTGIPESDRKDLETCLRRCDAVPVFYPWSSATKSPAWRVMPMPVAMGTGVFRPDGWSIQ